MPVEEDGSIAAPPAAAPGATAAPAGAEAATAAAAEKEEPYDAARDTAWKLQLWSAFEAAAGGEDPTCPRPIGCAGRLDKQPLPFLCPEVVLQDVGRLSLPLTAVQCREVARAAAAGTLAGGITLQQEELGAGAVQAGGTAGTVVVAAGSQVRIGNNWQPVLQRAVTAAAGDLRLQRAAVDSMEACLRELVLRQGPCSARSLDQEDQAPGTFATLLVQLPCCGGCTGGGLEVKNLEQTFAYDFSQESSRGLHYTVHYSSCTQQQLGPLAAGRQLLLVYDLVWKGPPGTGPQPPGVSNTQQQLQAAAAAWEEAIAAGSMQLRLALPLKGTYPKHSQWKWDPPMSNYAASLQPKDKKPTKRFGQPLTIDQLQDSDRSAAAALAACPALEVTLLLLNREVHGDQDQVLTYSRRKRKQLWGFDRGPRKRPAEAEGALHCQPEPPEELPEDADDGVDWDKAVEEEERRPRAVRQYGTDDYRMEFQDDSDCLYPVQDSITCRWLGLDGTEVDLGQFVADADFWHPAGRRVLWDLVRPQEEKVDYDYERETRSVMGEFGSIPNNSTRKYHKTYLVVTPRSYHHAAAVPGGPAAAQKQVLPLLNVALEAFGSLEERAAAAAQAADILHYAARFIRQAAVGASQPMQAGPHLHVEPALSLLLAAAQQVHAAKGFQPVIVEGQRVPAVAVPEELLAALSQLVAAVAVLPGVLGDQKFRLKQLLQVVPCIGEQAAAAGLRQAVAQLSSSRKEDCLVAIKAAAAWPWVQQQMSGALQLPAEPQEVLKSLGALPSLQEAQQQHMLAVLTQALHNSATRAEALKAALDATAGLPSWRGHPHLQGQAAAAVLEAVSQLPAASHYDACCKLSCCAWANWEPALQQQLLEIARNAVTAQLGAPGQQQQQQQRRMEDLCRRTQAMDKRLQQQVLEPYVAHILGDGAVLATQRVEDLHALSNLLLQPPHAPNAALHQQCAAALLQRPDAQEVLEVLVAVGGMRHPAVRGLPSVRQLLEARMAWLTQEQQRMAAAMQQQQLAVQMALQQRPWLGWTQPDAVIHSERKVQEFLRGSSSGSMVLDQYSKLKAIRGAFARLCGTRLVDASQAWQRPEACKASVQTSTHSFEAEIVPPAQANGRHQLVVYKTLCWLAPIAGRSKYQLFHEMEDLQQLLQGAAGQQG